MLRRKSGRYAPFARRRLAGTVDILLPRPRSSFGSTAAVPAVSDHPAQARSRPGPVPVDGRLAVAGRSVCRKYRKASIRRLQQQEYDKLCRIVPALSTRRHRRRISKVTTTSWLPKNVSNSHTDVVFILSVVNPLVEAFLNYSEAG